MPNEIESLIDLGATVGQIEHEQLRLGIRDSDQPTADPEWWSAYSAASGQGGDRTGEILTKMSRTPIDPDVLDRVRAYSGEPLPLGHLFIGVQGHLDDDECTYRSDGTDETYCGEPEIAHATSGQEEGGHDE